MLRSLTMVAAMAGGIFMATACSTARADGPAKSATSAVSATSVKAAPVTPPQPGRQIIILKLDDVVNIGAGWVRVIDYCEKNNVKAGLGIICDSLEKNDQAYLNWIKDHQKKGFIEFWCHGYFNVANFYTTHTLEEQTAALKKCETLAKEKLGFPLVAFGEHNSFTTSETQIAVQAVPELKVWLYGPKDSQYYKKLSIPRVNGLEYKVGAVDFDKFKDPYDKYGAREKVLVLQGHANYWDDTSFAAFTKIIDYLKSKNVVFMTPTEYLNFANKGK